MNIECQDISDDVHGCCSPSAQDSDKRPERLKPVRLITRQSRDEIYCVITVSLYLSYDSEAVGTGFSCRCDGEMSSGRGCVVGSVSHDASGFAACHALLSSCKTDVAPEPAVTQPCLGVAVILIEVRSVLPQWTDF